MAIIVPNATAICHDCNETVASGTLEINVGDWPFESTLATKCVLVTGELFFDCAANHNRMRQAGNSSLHDDFSIMEGKRVIGRLHAPGQVREGGMAINAAENYEIWRDLLVEAHKIRRERGF